MGMIGSCVFAGWITTLYHVPRLSDRIGRKAIFQIGLTLQLVMLIGLFTTTDLRATYVFMFIFGMALSARVTVGYVYMMELTHTNNKVMIGTLSGVIEVVVPLCATFYFRYISKYYLPFSYCGVLVGLFSLVLSLTAPESPILLL